MKVIKSIFKNLHSRVWAIITCVLIPLLLILSLLSMAIIPKVFENLLGTDPSSGRNSSVFATEGITNKKQALENANEVNKRICEEGFVLLKNEGVLPLKTSAENKKKISVFGKNSVNLVYGGSGSGAGDLTGAKTIYDSLSEANYDYNPQLKAFYESSASGTGRPANLAIEAGIPTGFATGETPVKSYESVKNSFSAYNELALVVISRTCGEGNDVPTTMKDTAGAFSPEDHYLELDQNEQDMLKMVCDNFSNVVLIINSSQTMELGFLDSLEDGDSSVITYDFASKIKGAIWIGGPGLSGIMALGEILNGTVNPSGRTVDTYARDFTKSPAYENFGCQSEDGGKSTSDAYIVGDKKQDAWYSDYEEGIYVGYRYYETRGAAKTDFSGREIIGGEGEKWYNDNVVYPFGYGLSYSKFNWTLKNKDELDGKNLTKDSQVNVTVHVDITPESEYAGKDVVQLYVRAPYNRGGIEKADRVLCAFAKTELIQPGSDGCDVTLTFDAYDIASYDSEGIKVNVGGYILEAGTYEFLINENSHKTVTYFTMEVENDITFESHTTSTLVKNQFSDVDDQLSEKLSRTDWEGTWPKPRTIEQRTVDQTFINKINSTETNNPLTAESEEVKTANLTLSNKKDKENSVKLWELSGKGYNDEAWDQFLECLTLNTIMDMTKMAAFGTPAIDYIGKPKTMEPDGPVGFTQFMSLTGSEVYETCAYASECVTGSTFNVELAEEMGVAIGIESVIGDTNDTYSGWYAPGVNLHRTPFGGRNYEYFSEDATLNGLMAASEVKGAWSKGVYAYMKHFVANDSETHRNGVCVWMTEQTLRELYLKPFEIAVKKSNCGERGFGAKGIMSSFNRLGTTWTGGDWRLLTQVLRNEWGFEGCVITDFVSGSYMNIRQMAYAGGDLYLNNVPAESWAKKNDKMDVYIAKNAAKNYLYVVANSNAMGGIGEGYSSRLADWKIALICIDCIIAVGLAVWGVFAVRSALRRVDEDKLTVNESIQ